MSKYSDLRAYVAGFSAYATLHFPTLHRSLARLPIHPVRHFIVRTPRTPLTRLPDFTQPHSVTTIITDTNDRRPLLLLASPASTNSQLASVLPFPSVDTFPSLPLPNPNDNGDCPSQHLASGFNASVRFPSRLWCSIQSIYRTTVIPHGSKQG